jgi:putative transposase
MPRFFHPILHLIARATHDELARQVQYLKVENEILRSRLPRRIIVTPVERMRLLRFGTLVGPTIRELITIVSPRTFARWISREHRRRSKRTPPRKPGRPRTPDDIRQLVLRIARETGWGYTRILGELRKLGIRNVSRSTVVNILREHGLSPGPSRSEGTWDQFVKMHARTLWACDFVSKRVWTRGGLVEHFILFFIHVQSRRVIVSNATRHPDAEWVAQQARNFCMEFQEQDDRPTHVIRDGDGKFRGAFDDILRSEGIAVQRLPIRAPNLNAHAERWVQSLKQECLDHFIVFGRRHLDYLISEYVEHYHTERPHQAKGNLPLTGAGPPRRFTGAPPGKIVCHERLGGLLRHYHRVAA